MTGLLVAAALAVLPSDRMAMADRLFDKGDYLAARREYTALVGETSIAKDELAFRLGECARELKEPAEARRYYSELIAANPLSPYVPRARLMKALAGTSEEQRKELPALDSLDVPADIRAAALYHLGVLTDDVDCFKRCFEADRKGRYAPFARFRRATLMGKSADPAVRRSASHEFLEIHYVTEGDMAREALHASAAQSYSDGRYRDAALLFQRYLKLYAKSQQVEEIRRLAAWSDFLSQRYMDALTLAETMSTDDGAYLKAACQEALGQRDVAQEAFRQYLVNYPQGLYRRQAELALSRAKFEEAEKTGNVDELVASAAQTVNLSTNVVDQMRLAWAYERAKRYPEATEVYEKVIASQPPQKYAVQALFRLGILEFNAESWSAAERRLAEALAKGCPESLEAEAWYWRGVAAIRLEHEEEGLGFLKTALGKPLSLDLAREARLMLADADYDAGRMDAAAGAYQKLIKEGATARLTAMKIEALGRFLMTRAAYEESLLCAQALIEQKDPVWRQAGYVLQGETTQKQDHSSDALVAFRKALAENVRTDRRAQAALEAGRIAFQLGEFEAAERDSRLAVELNEKNTARRLQAYLTLAKTCEAMGKLRDACGYATVVVTLFDDPAAAAEAQKILKAHPEVVR